MRVKGKEDDTKCDGNIGVSCGEQMSHPLVTRSECHPLFTFSEPTLRWALDFLQKTLEFT